MKQLQHILLLFSLGLVLTQCQSKPEGMTTEQLYEGFRQPSSEYRPFVRWWWNGDKVEADELVRELRLLKKAGIGGVEINPIAFPTYCDSLGKPSLQWLSPEWINMLKVCFDKADSLDMTCDLLVGSGWPFGGEFLNEDERAQIVVNYAQPVTGPTTLTLIRDSLCEKAMPKVSSPYKGNTKELMLLKLYPNPAKSVDEGIDVLQSDSIFVINVPEGQHTLAALVKINGFLEVINGAPGAAGPVLDHFNKDAVSKYLNNMSPTAWSSKAPTGPPTWPRNFNGAMATISPTTCLLSSSRSGRWAVRSITIRWCPSPTVSTPSSNVPATTSKTSRPS